MNTSQWIIRHLFFELPYWVEAPPAYLNPPPPYTVQPDKHGAFIEDASALFWTFDWLLEV